MRRWRRRRHGSRSISRRRRRRRRRRSLATVAAVGHRPPQRSVRSFFLSFSLSLSLSLSLHVGQLPTVAQELERKKKSISSTSDRPSVSCDLVRTKSHSFLMKLKNGRLDGENQTKQTNKQKKLESCRPTRENITWWCQFDRVSFEATE